MGAFDGLLRDMKVVPLRTRVASITLAPTAYSHGELAYKPLTSMQLVGHQLADREAVAILVLSDELLRSLDAESSALFKRELSNAVALVTDQQFISLISAGATTITSVGVDTAAIWTDLANAFAAIESDASSRLCMLVDSTTAKIFATKSTTSGTAAFPAMGAQGGMIANTPVVVTDGVSSGTWLLVDANAIAAGAGAVGLDISRQSSLQLESAPDSPATASTIQVGLWQSNHTALMARRVFGAELLRSTGVVMVVDVNYNSGNSPA